MVTKQEQLEWMSKAHKEWPFILDFICMCNKWVGNVSYVAGSHRITKREWQQERDKMSSKPKVDNSWHERGEFPLVGCECEYNDAAWGFGDVSVTPMDGDKLTVCAKSKTPSGRDCVIFTWVSKSGALLAAAAASPAVFRPLRTEREKAIDEMVSILVGCEKYAITQNLAMAASELLYDYGYHR